jgi:hypothetical protein
MMSDETETDGGFDAEQAAAKVRKFLAEADEDASVGVRNTPNRTEYIRADREYTVEVSRGKVLLKRRGVVRITLKPDTTFVHELPDLSDDSRGDLSTDGGVDTASAGVEFTDHGGHFHSDAFAWLDLNGFHDGEDHHSVDHLITNSGTVLIRVDGTPLGDLASEPYTHHRHDETGGVPAGGF